MGTFRVKLQYLSALSPGFSSSPTADLWYGASNNDGEDLNFSNQFAETLSASYPRDFGYVGYGASVPGNSTLQFQTLGSSIFLDGSDVLVEFNGLPVGFTALTALISCSNIFVNGASSATLFLRKDSGTEDTGTTITTGFNNVTFPYVFGIPPPTMLQIVSSGCGLRLNTTGAFGAVEFHTLEIIGTYEIQQFKFELTNDSPVTVGDTITVRSNDLPDSLDLNQITSINIQYVTAAGVFTTTAVPSFTVEQTGSSASSGISSELRFTMPNFTTAVQVTPYISGTQFSGSIPLGSLYTINFTEGSGIYRLVADKTNDTLYANGTPQLVNAKIPNPFIKTSFIP